MGAETPNQCFKHNLTELKDLIELFANSMSKTVVTPYIFCLILSRFQLSKNNL